MLNSLSYVHIVWVINPKWSCKYSSSCKYFAIPGAVAVYMSKQLFIVNLVQLRGSFSIYMTNLVINDVLVNPKKEIHFTSMHRHNCWLSVLLLYHNTSAPWNPCNLRLDSKGTRNISLIMEKIRNIIQSCSHHCKNCAGHCGQYLCIDFS